MGNEEVTNIWQQGRIESQREWGPKRAQACTWLKHRDDKEAAFKDKPEITLAKERNQTASKSPGEAQPESYGTVSTPERATEMERPKTPKAGRAPHTRPLTRRLCACLAFSSSSFLLFLVTPDLSFAAQLRDLSKGVSPTPILGGLITDLLVWSALPGKSLQLAQMALQVPLRLSPSFKCQFLRSYFLSIFTHQCLAYSGVQ